MRHRGLTIPVLVVLSLAIASISAVGQRAPSASDAGTTPRTAWGHPDLQGTWTNTTTTPLERPEDLAGKELLTDEEWALRNPETGLSDDRPSGDPVGFYNDYWLEQGELSMRTSLIVEPSDGRLPPVTKSEELLQSGRTSSYSSIGGAQFDSWTDFNVYDRCITRGLPGAMTPGFYNHNYQIFQTPEYVVIMVEMIHDARIIPLDGRSHLPPSMRQWMGDARGRWEGDTLIVETDRLDPLLLTWDGHPLAGGNDTRVIERYRRVGDQLELELTVEDAVYWREPLMRTVRYNPAANLEILDYGCDPTVSTNWRAPE